MDYLGLKRASMFAVYKHTDKPDKPVCLVLYYFVAAAVEHREFYVCLQILILIQILILVTHAQPSAAFLSCTYLLIHFS